MPGVLIRGLAGLLLLVSTTAACAGKQGPPGPAAITYAPPPASIVTPGTVDTRIGALRFFDGLPDERTVERVYDHLDFLRGVRAYLNAIPAASMMALRTGLYAADALPNYTVLITESLLDARSRFLTLDTETVYATVWINLKGGPIVVETPPKTLGAINDAWQRHLADTGYPGPDRGRGGRYVIVPPGYAGYVPDTPFAVRSPTFNVWVIFQGFLVDGSPRPTVASFKERLKIYPLKESERPPPNHFLDLSGKAINTIAASDFSYFEAIDDLVQEEPRGSQDPELLGLLTSIGIEKDRKFGPDPRMRAILEEAAAVGSATARAMVFSDRTSQAMYPNSQWNSAFVDGYGFEQDHAALLDARARFYSYATAHDPAGVDTVFGKRAESVIAFRDRDGHLLDGGKAYSLTLPPDVPVKSFWSIVVYDNQTRSMLQTDQRFAGINSAQSLVQERGELQIDEDGSITLYFAPRPPPQTREGRTAKRAGRDSNWIQTVPGKGWNVILRVYGALDSWHDRSWRPGEIQPLARIPPVRSTKRRPFEMATRLPRALTLPNRIETRIGTLELVDGVPTEETTRLLYDNLDFVRGVDAFLTTIPGASLVAMRRGLRSVDIEDPETVGIFDRFVDAHSLLLTANTDNVYAGTWLDLSKGALVVNSPPQTPGVVDDFFARPVTDLGIAGPDAGEGGLFLFTPPDYRGQISERYFAFESKTDGNVLMWQSLVPDGNPDPTSTALRGQVEVYPFDFDFDEDFDFEADFEADTEVQPEEPDEDEDEDATAFVGLSGRAFNTIHPNDIGYYDHLDALIQDERPEAFSPELLGLLRAIGIEHGQRFAPDARMRETLTDSAAVANATARALAFRPRDRSAYRNGGSSWYTNLVGNSSAFIRNGARLLDARTAFHYLTAMVSPAMVVARIGTGAQEALIATDGQGRYLDGGQSYSLKLPPDVPVKRLWSIAIYDPQTRSLLQTPRSATPSLSNRGNALLVDQEGSTTLHFGPEPPAGREANWIQTVPGKGWFAILHLYEPLKPWFDGTWDPGEITRAR